jgi:hypothetical protein
MTRVVESIEIFSGVSLSQLARLTGLARETVKRRLVDSGLQSSGERGGYPVYRPKDALAAVYQMSGDDFDPDRLKPFERLKHYQAEREKLHLALERRDVVPMIEVEQVYGKRNKLITRLLETITDRLERGGGVPAVVLALVDRMVDEIMDELHALRLDEDDADSPDRQSA